MEHYAGLFDPLGGADSAKRRLLPRKIAVPMLALWKNETEYQWTKEAAA